VARLLPPGLSESDFDTAIARFREVVGDKFVATEDGDLARYRDPYPVGSEPATGASAAISPESTEQVQEIVRIANEYGIPLSPISTGKNNGYGGGETRVVGVGGG
jgi:4-cresol dehydrogenase (hydroxylating) flavoprotein subunit